MARPKAQKTWIPRGGSVDRKWYVVDAAGAVLGRLATRVATVLMGKHKAAYTPFIDMGDHVVVVNAAKVKLTGEKARQRIYMTYSGYMGGEKYVPFAKRFAEEPEEVVRHAIVRMLPKTTLGTQMARKLKVYADDKHEHAAQRPESLDLQSVRKGRTCP